MSNYQPSPPPNGTVTLFSANVPLLSAAVVICCAPDSDDEIKLFWHDADEFCKRFRLTAEQTTLMKAPIGQPKDATGKEIPTQQQLDDVGEALIAELRSKMPAAPPARSLPKPLDPARTARFPVILRLYEIYALGKGDAYTTWEEELQKELGKGDHLPVW